MGHESPSKNWSRSSRKGVKTYNTTKRNCSFVVWAAQLLSTYLKGLQSTVRMDHDALQWMLSMKDKTGELPRGRLRLSVFHFEVVHRDSIKG